LALGGIAWAGCGLNANDQRASLGARSHLGTSAPGASECAALQDAPESADYDPWEPFNEKTFWFNYQVFDRYLMKPAATVWHDAIPEPARRGLSNAFYNVGAPGRLVNNLLQARFEGAGWETADLLINTTIGVGGLIDVASRLGMRKSDADAGQTLGTYGFGPGPYLVLPLLPPLTVRDGIGYGIDGLLDPLYYFVPLIPNVAMSAAKALNDRAANLQLFQDVEETSLDLYAAVRNGYLQRRARSIARAIAERDGDTDADAIFLSAAAQAPGICADARLPASTQHFSAPGFQSPSPQVNR